MGGLARRASYAAVAVAAMLALAAPGRADTIVRDLQGRPIRFDVRATGVDVEWYANLLRHSAHGDEIAGVTIRVVDYDELRSRCGPEAAGCYRGSDGEGTITVPPPPARRPRARSSTSTATTSTTRSTSTA